MALQTTGTIGHAEIMAEFEKTGKFDLSADGAALIDKTTGQIINESDFYGASNAPAAGQGSIGNDTTQPNVCFFNPQKVGDGSGRLGTSQPYEGCGWKLSAAEGNWAATSHAWILPWKTFADGSTNIRFSYKTHKSNGRTSQYASMVWRSIMELNLGGTLGPNQDGWAPMDMSTAKGGTPGGANEYNSANAGFHFIDVNESTTIEAWIDNDGSVDVNRIKNFQIRERSFVNISQAYEGRSAPTIPVDTRLKQVVSYGNTSLTEVIMYYVRMENA